MQLPMQYVQKSCQLTHTFLSSQEMQHLQKRSGSQVSELQALAEEQFNRANKLSDELMRIKSKKQVNLLQDFSPFIPDI